VNELGLPAAPPGLARPSGRASLHDTVVDRLRDMIVEGELIAGARVPERELTQRLGVSRTPLREALKVLASEGLIELLPNRGARVARLTEVDVEEMFQVMGALEGLAGELACQRVTDDELAALRALHYEMMAHHARGDLPAYFKANQAIHEGIIGAARNAVLSTTYSMLAGRIRRARYRANLSPERWDEAVAEHERILETLVKRDGTTLAWLLRQHLRNKCEVVKAALAAAASTTDA